MKKLGLCAICGRPSEYSCKLCGQPVCASHYDPSTEMCTRCSGTYRKDEKGFRPGNLIK